MQIKVALQDGFDGDNVVIRVDGVEAYHGEQLTTRTQISPAAGTRLEVPDRPFTLEVDVTTRRVYETLRLDPHAQPNVTLSLRDGELVAAFPERLGLP